MLRRAHPLAAEFDADACISAKAVHSSPTARVLNLSEGSAYNRIETARGTALSRAYRALDRGDHVTAARLLAPHLTPENRRGSWRPHI